MTTSKPWYTTYTPRKALGLLVVRRWHSSIGGTLRMSTLMTSLGRLVGTREELL